MRPNIHTRPARKKMKLTQEEFANLFSIPLKTLQNWEQGESVPSPASLVLIALINDNPEEMRDRVIRVMKERVTK